MMLKKQNLLSGWLLPRSTHSSLQRPVLSLRTVQLPASRYAEIDCPIDFVPILKTNLKRKHAGSVGVRTMSEPYINGELNAVELLHPCS